MVDSLVRDIQNTQCLLNVEHSGVTCPHVTLQFADSKDDVGLSLVKEGMVMVDVRKEKHLQKMVGKWPPWRNSKREMKVMFTLSFQYYNDFIRALWPKQMCFMYQC